MYKKLGKLGLSWAKALAVAPIVALAAPAHAEGDPVKVGLVLPQSGALLAIGQTIEEGYEAARKMLGPVPMNGEMREIEFVIEQASPDGWDPGLASAACLRLKQAGVAAISGLGGGEGEGCNSVASRLEIPIIGVNLGTAGVVTDKCSKWFIALSYNPPMGGQAFKIVANERFGDVIADDWWVVSDAPDWGRDFALALQGAADLKYDTIDITPPGTTDWGPFLTKMRSSGAPVGVVITSWGDQYLAFIKQASDFGVDEAMRLIAPIGVPEWLIYEPGVADALSRWTFPMQWGGLWSYEDNWPMLKEYNQVHYDMYGRPPSGQGLYAAASYFMLWNALKEAGTTDPEPLMDKLLTEKVDTPLWENPVSVDLPGRQVAIPMFVTEVQKLEQTTYGVDYAHVATKVLSYEETRVSPEDLGCTIGGVN